MSVACAVAAHAEAPRAGEAEGVAKASRASIGERALAEASLDEGLEGRLASGSPARSAAPESADLAAVRALEEGVARVLAEEGFEAYSELFDPDYRNWADDRPLRDRDEFLAGIEVWYEAGNRAVKTEMTPVSIELFGDLALSLYRLTEEFADGSRFTGRFVSLARKRDGRWRLFRTTFTTVERVAAASDRGGRQP